MVAGVDQLGHRVAIKVVRPDIDAGGTRYERFRREAQIAARIPSERVAKVYDFGLLDGGLPFLVMEFLAGGDLRAEVRDHGPLPVTDAVDYPMKPPVGGDHDPVWMNCDGEVYKKSIPDMNAVHALEHGSVWVTYTDDAPAAVADLALDWFERAA